MCKVGEQKNRKIDDHVDTVFENRRFFLLARITYQLAKTQRPQFPSAYLTPLVCRPPRRTRQSALGTLGQAIQQGTNRTKRTKRTKHAERPKCAQGPKRARTAIQFPLRSISNLFVRPGLLSSWLHNQQKTVLSFLKLTVLMG